MKKLTLQTKPKNYHKMKKILIGIMLMLLSISAKAQILEELNSISILGKWKVAEVIGDEASFFNRYGFYVRCTRPKIIEFKYPDNGGSNTYCKVTFTGGDETAERYYNGYWIEGSGILGDKVYILHIWDQKEQDIYNLKVDYYNGTEIELSTYNGNNVIRFTRKGYAGVESVETDNEPEDDKIFSTNGMQLKEPMKGIIIKGGKKYISK